MCTIVLCYNSAHHRVWSNLRDGRLCRSAAPKMSSSLHSSATRSGGAARGARGDLIAMPPLQSIPLPLSAPPKFLEPKRKRHPEYFLGGLQACQTFISLVWFARQMALIESSQTYLSIALEFCFNFISSYNKQQKTLNDKNSRW